MDPNYYYGTNWLKGKVLTGTTSENGLKWFFDLNIPRFPLHSYPSLFWIHRFEMTFV